MGLKHELCLLGVVAIMLALVVAGASAISYDLTGNDSARSSQEVPILAFNVSNTSSTGNSMGSIVVNYTGLIPSTNIVSVTVYSAETAIGSGTVWDPNNQMSIPLTKTVTGEENLTVEVLIGESAPGGTVAVLVDNVSAGDNVSYDTLPYDPSGQIFVDNTVPTYSWIASVIADGSYVRAIDNIGIKYNLTDDGSGIDNTAVITSASNGAVHSQDCTVSITNGYNCTAQFNATGLLDGSANYFSTLANDTITYGNDNQLNTNIAQLIVDDTAPGLAWIGADTAGGNYDKSENASYASANRVYFKFNATDDGSGVDNTTDDTAVWADGGAAKPVINVNRAVNLTADEKYYNITFEWNGTGASDGQYNVTVAVNDTIASGGGNDNQGASTIEIYRDTASPAFEKSTSNNLWISNSSAVLELNVTDEYSGVTKGTINMTTSNGSIAFDPSNNCTGTSAEYKCNATWTLPGTDGQYAIDVVANDTITLGGDNKNSTSSFWTLNRDTTAPTFSTTFTNQTNSSASDLSMNVSITDGGAGVDNNTVYVAFYNGTGYYNDTGSYNTTIGNVWTQLANDSACSAGGSCDFNFTINTTALPDDTYSVYIMSNDSISAGYGLANEGNLTTYAFTADNAVPTMSLSVADTSITTSGSTTISCTCSDGTGTGCRSSAGSITITKPSGDTASHTSGNTWEPDGGAGDYSVSCAGVDDYANNTAATQTSTITVTSSGGGGGSSGDGEETTFGKLSGGEERHLAEGEELKFNYSGEEHAIKVKNYTADTATFVITSKPLEITLKVGESKQLDLDADGEEDIVLHLNKIEDDKVYFTVNELEPAEEPAEEEEAGMSIWWIVGIVAAVLAVAAVLYFVTARKK